MSTIHSLKFGLFSLSLILISSCSETIIREIPAETQSTSATNSTSPSSTPSTPLTGNISAEQNELAPVAGTTREFDDNTVSNTEITTLPLASLSTTQGNAIVGRPGMAVDCVNSVPCRWISEDEALSITVTNADNIATRERLTVQFRVDTLHDSSVSLSTSTKATDASGIGYTVTDQSLGIGNGISPSSVVAGSPITGSLSYDKGTDEISIARSNVSVLDNGYLREGVFLNLPVGPSSVSSVDCAFILPCTWELPDGRSLVTLVSAGGLNGTGNLAINFTIDVTTNTDIALDGGSTADGADGTQFEGRTHSLGNERGYAKLTHRTTAGSSVPGTVNFSRTGTSPDKLNEIKLIIYEDAPVPRWNPTFLNVHLN